MLIGTGPSIALQGHERSPGKIRGRKADPMCWPSGSTAVGSTSLAHVWSAKTSREIRGAMARHPPGTVRVGPHLSGSSSSATRIGVVVPPSGIKTFGMGIAVLHFFAAGGEDAWTAWDAALPRRPSYRSSR